jgi:hypothetical protein
MHLKSFPLYSYTSCNLLLTYTLDKIPGIKFKNFCPMRGKIATAFILKPFSEELKITE